MRSEFKTCDIVFFIFLVLPLWKFVEMVSSEIIAPERMRAISSSGLRQRGFGPKFSTGVHIEDVPRKLLGIAVSRKTRSP